MSAMTVYDGTRTMRREQAAQALRELADELASGNGLELERDGKRLRVRVADEVELGLEVELDEDGAELEIELRWWSDDAARGT